MTKRWAEIVAATLRNRLSQIELHRQIEELQRVLTSSLRGEFELHGDPGVELRGLLAELSRLRARQGFTATETAVSIFALKDALLEVVDVAGADARGLRDYVAYSRLIDEMGLFTFESYAKARERRASPAAPTPIWPSRSCGRTWSRATSRGSSWNALTS